MSKKIPKVSWAGGYDRIEEDIEKNIKAGCHMMRIGLSLAKEYEGYNNPIAFRKVKKVYDSLPQNDKNVTA